MPPVRWKVFILIAVSIIQQCYSTIVYQQSQRLQQPVSQVTADGWRPIIGNNNQFRQYSVEESTGRPVSTSSIQPPPRNQLPLTVQHIQYVPSTLSPSTVATPILSTPFNNNNKPIKIQTSVYGLKNKIPHGKLGPTSNQVFMMPTHGKPHVIPIGPRGPTIITPASVFRSPPISKMPQSIAQKRKPMRVQQTSHSQKDEIFAQAPSSAIGTYTFYNQAIPSHRIRDSSPLGSTKFHIQQPHGHIEFTNHFGLKNGASSHDDIIQQQTLREITNSHFLFQNPGDEFALNLVPPPPAKAFQDKPKEVKNLLKIKPAPIGEPIINGDPDLLIEKQNLVLSGIPSTYPGHSLNPPFNKGEQLVDFQITKEKFNVYHNNVPPNYEPQKFPQFENLEVKPAEPQTKYPFENLNVKPLDSPKPIKQHHYEVTEGKQWLEPALPFHPHFPSSLPAAHPTRETLSEIRQSHRTRRPQKQDFLSKPFLPTPLSPDHLNPTIPTQSEASSVYNLVSNKNNIKATIDPQFFNVKEVSTHYPILSEFELGTKEPEYSNEVFDNEPVRPSASPTQATDTTTKSTRLNQRRRRPGVRQRTTTTTEETPSAVEDYMDETEVQRPRPRPISRTRTTEAPATTTITYRTRQRPTEERRNKPGRLRTRPTPPDDMPSNHKMTAPAESTKQSFVAQEYDSEDSMELNKVPSSMKTFTTTYELPIVNHFNKQSDSGEDYGEVGIGHFMQPYDREKSKSRNRDRVRHREQEVRPSTNYEYVEEASQEDSKFTKKRNRYEESDLPPLKVHSTAEPYPTTNLHTPENEVDYTTITPERQPTTPIITIQEITKKEPETTTPPSTTTTTTTTTVETTTNKLNRLRQRPNKYESNQRPRFSVKDYRQRLQQATTTTSTTESTGKSTDSPRLRFPIRMRTTTTTQSPSRTTEDSTDSVPTEHPKYKFMPKDPRFTRTTDSPSESTTERNVKSINTRLRPFMRSRGTSTESPSTTTTQKISIKPNIFSNLRKPPSISLKQRIQNKQKLIGQMSTTEKEDTKTTSKPPPMESTEAEPTDFPETTLFNDLKPDSTTEMTANRHQQHTDIDNVEMDTEASVEVNDDEQNSPDIMKSESFLLSQRVSDLTSSAKKEYETPGLFKSVSPNSRRVPNYFTIATDDPRLPIEAFFPNLGKKE